MSDVIYMLDTNTVSYLLRTQNSGIKSKLVKAGISNVCISSLTEAELLYGLSQNPNAVALKKLVDGFISRVDSVPWGSDAAQCYAQLRSSAKAKGFTLSNMDMLIGAHSISLGVTLVTSDKAFSHLSKWIKVVNWVRKK